MKSFFDKLNLRPNERRLVIIVAIIVFNILNAIFVWPHFGDWGRLQKRQRESTTLLTAYEDEIRRTPQYQVQMDQLEKAGASVASEEQALKLSTTVNNQALLSGVQVNRYVSGRPTTSTKPNLFFEEQTGLIEVIAEEKALVDFLYNLGVGGSLIRVRSMTLNPDAVRQKLQGNITLVASYAKKAPPKAVATAVPARTNAPVASPRSTNSPARSGSPFGRTNTNTPAKTNAPKTK